MPQTKDVVDVLGDLVASASVNPDHDVERTEFPFGEGRVADYIEEFFRPFDVKIERQEVVRGRPNILVHVAGGSPMVKPILVDSHMDTVTGEGMDNPFTPRVADGRLYGRGACDTKGSLAAAMVAVREILTEASPLERGICLVGSMDEEYLAKGMYHLLDSGIQFSAAVVGEPTNAQVISTLKGGMWFRIITRGEPGHASNPDAGVNAIYIMNEVIDAIRRRAAQAYPRQTHPILGSAVLSVGRISGGSAEASVVPISCDITIDHRMLPGRTGDEAIEEMRSWVSEELGAHSARVQFEAPTLYVPPFETPLGHPLVVGLLRACEDVVGAHQTTGYAPYGCHASLTSAVGVPSVAFGPGSFAQAHSTLEYVELDQLTNAVKVLKRFLLAYANMLPGDP